MFNDFGPVAPWLSFQRFLDSVVSQAQAIRRRKARAGASRGEVLLSIIPPHFCDFVVVAAAAVTN